MYNNITNRNGNSKAMIKYKNVKNKIAQYI